MKLPTAVAALSLFFALGCSKKAGGGASRVPVTIARAEQRPVPYELSGTGTVEPRQTASVQAQVTGILTRVAFHEGDDVAAGQLLFQIDPRPFQATLDQAQAMLQRDQAQAQSAAADAERYAELVKQDYVTKSDYEARRAAAEALQAAMRADSAAVANARDRKSTRLNSSHDQISYAVFCLKKKKTVTLLRHGHAIPLSPAWHSSRQQRRSCTARKRAVRPLLTLATWLRAIRVPHRQRPSSC